jgi:hypothetical protein
MTLDSRATPRIPAAPDVFSPNTGLGYRVAGAAGCKGVGLQPAFPAAPARLNPSPVFGENTGGRYFCRLELAEVLVWPWYKPPYPAGRIPVGSWRFRSRPGTWWCREALIRRIGEDAGKVHSKAFKTFNDPPVE